MTQSQTLPVVVVGAGPIGLATAVHLINRGETPIVFEAGDEIAHTVRQWGHVRMFSPWKITMDPQAVALLETNGWQSPPPDELPTGKQLVEDYLEPLADLPVIKQALRLNTRVIGVSRLAKDKMKDADRADSPFVIQVESADGDIDIVEAKAVIDASGTWTRPNPIGANGLYAIGEREHNDRIFYGIPDIHGLHHERYADKRVAVVGGGHSAINALLELADIQPQYPTMEIYWVLRKPSVALAYGGLGDDSLPARGKLGLRIKALVDAQQINVVTPFFTRKIESHGQDIRLIGDTPDGEAGLVVDEIIAATGFRPDLDFLREVRINLDPSVESPLALAPLIDPNIHSCGTVPPHGENELRHPEKNFYIVGMKSYGRAPTFLLATGYEQVRSVVAAIAGDWEAAQNVELCLPETGICGTDLVPIETEKVHGVKVADTMIHVTSNQSSCCL